MSAAFLPWALILRTSAALNANSILSVRDLLGETVHRVELLDSEFVSPLVARWFERVRILRFAGLADVDD